MKDLQKELEELKELSGFAFKKRASELRKKYNTSKEIAEINQFIASGFYQIENDLNHIKEALLLRDQLIEISKFISLSYISEIYFHKSKTWLNRRIKEFELSGKSQFLSNKEKEILSFALKDMAKKLSSFTVV